MPLPSDRSLLPPKPRLVEGLPSGTSRWERTGQIAMDQGLLPNALGKCLSEVAQVAYQGILARAGPDDLRQPALLRSAPARIQKRSGSTTIRPDLENLVSLLNPMEAQVMMGPSFWPSVRYQR